MGPEANASMHSNQGTFPSSPMFAWQHIAKLEGSARTLLGPKIKYIYWSRIKGQWITLYEKKQLPDKIFQFNMREK